MLVCSRPGFRSGEHMKCKCLSVCISCELACSIKWCSNLQWCEHLRRWTHRAALETTHTGLEDTQGHTLGTFQVNAHLLNYHSSVGVNVKKGPVILMSVVTFVIRCWCFCLTDKADPNPKASVFHDPDRQALACDHLKMNQYSWMTHHHFLPLSKVKPLYIITAISQSRASTTAARKQRRRNHLRFGFGLRRGRGPLRTRWFWILAKDEWGRRSWKNYMSNQVSKSSLLTGSKCSWCSVCEVLLQYSHLEERKYLLF